MDIEILANRLLEYALNENATEYDRLVMADTVHELSRLLTEKNLAENRAERHKRDAVALKSENEKLRAELNDMKTKWDKYQRAFAKQWWEQDSGFPCCWCKFEKSGDCEWKAKHPSEERICAGRAFEWRGPQKED